MNRSKLDELRSPYRPELPSVLAGGSISFKNEEGPAGSTGHAQIAAAFPHTIDKPVVTIAASGTSDLSSEPLKIGVVFSGGQAPGGHNVVAGLFDAMMKANSSSELIGFLDGPIGVINGKSQKITAELLDSYRNTGGFDLIGSGRNKIEKPEELKSCLENLKGFHGLVVVGGDDSNTNAAVLAEYLLQNGSPVKVIGVPKTIDGDMKNDYIEASFGFDTASKVFSELVGSICRDAISARKYWHFIRLMGRAASHITLEVALQTRPNLAIISEEVQEKGLTLENVVDQIVDAVVKRQEAGKSYGVILIPEGLLEFTSDIKGMIAELSTILGKHGDYLKSLPDHSERVQFLANELSAESNRVYNTLPQGIQEVLLTRDKHGNVPLSQVETEKLLIDLVSDQIRYLKAEKKFEGSFSPLGHFFGYEGRCVQPSNFDADYCYALGYTACQLVRGGYTGYTVSARNLAAPVSEWVMGGIPVTSMLTIEIRKGKPTPVIEKKLVELESPAFKAFADARAGWIVDDRYLFPGPIQYFGPEHLANARTRTLELEKGV